MESVWVKSLKRRTKINFIETFQNLQMFKVLIYGSLSFRFYAPVSQSNKNTSMKINITTCKEKVKRDWIGFNIAKIKKKKQSS